MASEAEDTEHHPAKRPRLASESESIPINKQFNNIHDTNVTLESAEGVLFYISDFYLKAASLMFRDMLTLPQSKPGRPHIKLEESEAVLTVLLHTTCHRPKEVIEQIISLMVEVLKDVLEATDKYAMDDYQDEIKQAIIKKLDQSLPVENMAYCAKWRNSAAICTILQLRATWDENAYEGMKPWKLSISTISAMGIDLFRMCVEAYHTACRSSATDVLLDDTVNMRLENPETCECNWDLCALNLSRLANQWGSGYLSGYLWGV